MQEGKVIVWGGFTNSWGKTRSKRQGRKGKVYQLNAEFQRIARRDKKAFLNEQCLEKEENNRVGNTSNLFKKIGNIKTTFHARIGSIKGRDGMDLTEAEDISRRWQEWTQSKSEHQHSRNQQTKMDWNHRATVQKGSPWPGWSWWCDHSPGAGHPGMWSQVGLKKHHYKQS